MRIRHISTFLIVCTLFFGCLLPEEEVIDEYENILIFSGDNSLVDDTDTLISLESEDPSRAPVENFEYTIEQIAQIDPTIVNGHTVQANDILIFGPKAYVAYNTAGPVFDGAIQVIFKLGKKVFLTMEIQFSDMDIICLYRQGSEIIFGGMANPDVFEGKRSFIGRINLIRPKASDIADSIVFLSSYAATGVTSYDDNVYVSLGAADGGIKILDKDMVPVQGTLDEPDILADDIRDIGNFDDGVIALAGTTDSDASTASLLILKDGALDNSIPIENFDSPEAKATVEVNDNYAYLGLSAKGFQVYDMISEELLFTCDNPDEDPLHVTNSISYNDNLIFSANGEYGFRVLDYTPSASSAEIVGYYSFDGLMDDEGQNYSANHIAFRSKYLIVASGAGGVLFYELSNK
jgi:hypothetical protein